jgi:CheY-specific phosphatase CheX
MKERKEGRLNERVRKKQVDPMTEAIYHLLKTSSSTEPEVESTKTKSQVTS